MADNQPAPDTDWSAPCYCGCGMTADAVVESIREREGGISRESGESVYHAIRAYQNGPRANGW